MLNLPPEVFLVEDDLAVRKNREQALAMADIAVRGFANAESMLAALATGARPALVISDVRLPDRDIRNVLAELRQFDHNVPVLLITGHNDLAMAVEAVHDGAHDFIEKPFSSGRLVSAAQRALEQHALAEENRRLRERMGIAGIERIIGQSPAMQRIRQRVSTLAPSGVDILLNGETGVGKDMVARTIHDASGRRGPFVAIHCGALLDSVLERELFGHQASAVSRTGKRHISRIEYASGGTLFLDEIETMPLNLQVKLLQVLQARSIGRPGSHAPIAVDCRVVTASKADLKTAAEHGHFHADLFHHLNVVSLDIPPLRQRREDIPLLMATFLHAAARRHQRPQADWTPADLARWSAYDWPGNVRELKHTAERWALGLPDDLPGSDTLPDQPPGPPRASLAEQIDQVEKQLIEDALRHCAGQVTRTAEWLGTPRKTLYDKLQRHGIQPEAFRR